MYPPFLSQTVRLNRTRLPFRRSPRRMAMTLMEVMIAMSIFTVVLGGFISLIMWMRNMNRDITQRETAMAQAREIMDLFRSFAAVDGYNGIRYSTASSPIYLKYLAIDPDVPDTRWALPTSNSDWKPLYVLSDANNTAKEIRLPEAQWSISLDPPVVRPGPPVWEYRPIWVEVRWKSLVGMGTWKTVTLGTYLTRNFGGL